METVNGQTLSDLYGDDADDLPEWIWEEIRHMVMTLLDDEGIEYVDITPYNFMQVGKRIVMVDFGDAKYSDGEVDWFIKEFLEGQNSWNSDFE